MRILYVVQRYGVDVAGGAEAHCRLFAERMVTRGHDVSVLTSCARDYATWADHYPPGREVIGGVDVLRLPVERPRDPERFDALSQRVVDPARRRPAIEEAWMNEQGPTLVGFGEQLRAEAAKVDVVVFFTYLYATTVVGLRELGGRAPAVVHPTAHDEWPMRLPIIRTVFDRADGLALSTPEELELVELRFRSKSRKSVIGIGFEPPATTPDVAAFRRDFGLDDDRYVVCLGRIDPNKGASEAISFVQESRRRGAPVRLVMCGAEMMEIDDRDGLVVTGFVDDDQRWAALAGAEVLVQPSRQESFGMTLAEAWLQRRPALVQRACDVTAGLARRSQGGLAYGGFAEYDAALGLLLERPELRDRLGANGERHVREVYAWDAVMGRYEDLLEGVVADVAAQA